MQDNNIPWIEKYRPSSLENIKSQDFIKTSLQKLVERNTIPHLLFFGSSGTGKTSSILACINELKKKGYIVSKLELNTSDQRGIKTVRKKIKELNNDNSVSGILVQLPLPNQIRQEKIINSIDPSKDVDGFCPINVGNLASGYDGIVPCTPKGCLMLIKKIEQNLSGKHAVIIGRSNLNGKPIAQLLLKENCTITITHSKTKDLKEKSEEIQKEMQRKY